MATDTQSIHARHSKSTIRPEEGFESGLRSGELDVREWKRASGTALAEAVKCAAMMNMAPIFLRNSLQLGTFANSATHPSSLVAMVLLFPELWSESDRQLEMERAQMMTGCKLTLSRKVRERAKVKTNTREEIARASRPTRAIQTSKRARTVANLDIGRKTAGILVEERMTITPTEIPAKGKSKHTGKGKGKHVDVVETEQPQLSETASTVSYPSQDP